MKKNSDEADFSRSRITFSGNDLRRSRLDFAFQYYERLTKVNEYIQAHYSEPISLLEVSRVAALQPKYFSAFFRQKTGLTFRRWLAEVRISEAVELMKTDGHSITEIAFKVGFNDLRTFERNFKACRGMTPRKFRSLYTGQ